MTEPKRPAHQAGRRANTRRDPRTEPAPKSEEDLQPKDAGEMPLEPQDPVDPSPDPTS